MDGSALLIFALGAGAAGFVSGLTGLGTALTALAFWLHVTTPQIAVPMAASIAVLSHLITLTYIRQGIVWRRVWPFLLGGLIGLPIGVAALSVLSGDAAKAGLGAFLILYCTYGLAVRRPPVIAGGGRPADGAVGFGGGFLGGLSGVSGPLPTIWAGLRGWPKDEQRGVYQPFNLVILGLSVAGHGLYDRFDPVAGTEALIAFACAAGGSILGITTYRRTSDRNFRRIVLILLLIGGITHLIAWLARN
ncbi:MAG: sulfite exporter TauE/SafE family protein [Alphaproteobacteria bacterium]|nr:sulfite exporter TauE/SafE family protein [Alphaproteobacteria bacterium]